jgi:imidazolonepropionase-like amidohydrolase
MVPILLKNCLLIYYDKETAIKNDILIIDGKIKSIAPHICIDSSDFKVIDMEEKYVMPGLIDCHTHLGILE